MASCFEREFLRNVRVEGCARRAGRLRSNQELTSQCKRSDRETRGTPRRRWRRPRRYLARRTWRHALHSGTKDRPQRRPPRQRPRRLPSREGPCEHGGPDHRRVFYESRLGRPDGYPKEWTPLLRHPRRRRERPSSVFDRGWRSRFSAQIGFAGRKPNRLQRTGRRRIITGVFSFELEENATEALSSFPMAILTGA